MLDDSLLSRYPGSIFALLDANGTESFTITRTITGVLKCSVSVCEATLFGYFSQCGLSPHLNTDLLNQVPATVSNEGRR